MIINCNISFRSILEFKRNAVIKMYNEEESKNYVIRNYKRFKVIFVIALCFLSFVGITYLIYCIKTGDLSKMPVVILVYFGFFAIFMFLWKYFSNDIGSINCFEDKTIIMTARKTYTLNSDKFIEVKYDTLSNTIFFKYKDEEKQRRFFYRAYRPTKRTGAPMSPLKRIYNDMNLEISLPDIQMLRINMKNAKFTGFNNINR